MTAHEAGDERPPVVSILVVTYRNPALTRDCLRSIAEHVPSELYELLVLDNSSGDGTVEMIASEFPSAQLEASPINLGFARANNVLAERARGQYLLLLNPDTVVWEGAVEALLDLAARHPEAGLYGGRTMSPSGALEPSSCWGAPTLWSLACYATGLSWLFGGTRRFDPESLGPWQRDTEAQVDIVTGCLALITRDLWQALGGFDESFWMYGEDADLSLRVAARGYRPMITPAAVVTHVIGASSTLGGKSQLVLGAKARLLRKHWSPARARIGIVLLRLGCAIRALAGNEEWRAAWRNRRSWSAPDYDARRSAAPARSS